MAKNVMKSKKGIGWGWEVIGKIIIVVAILVVVLFIVFMIKGKSIALWDTIKDLLRFGR